MGYRGAGGPPPPRKGNFGGRPKPLHYFSEKVKGKSGPEAKILRPFKIFAGKQDIPIVALDHGSDPYSCYIHAFALKGSLDNMVVCPSPGEDDPPCPVCIALNKRAFWNGVLSIIDRSKWSPTEGKNAGKVYTDTRKLALIGSKSGPSYEELGRKVKSWHGYCFDVSRPEPAVGEDGKKDWTGSPKIGLWFPVRTMSREELKTEFEKAAVGYGMPVEEFIEPANYDLIFKPKSLDQLKAIAKDIAADLSAVKAAQAAQDRDGDGGGDDGDGVGAAAGDDDSSAISY